MSIDNIRESLGCRIQFSSKHDEHHVSAPIMVRPTLAKHVPVITTSRDSFLDSKQKTRSWSLKKWGGIWSFTPNLYLNTRIMSLLRAKLEMCSQAFFYVYQSEDLNSHKQAGASWRELKGAGMAQEIFRSCGIVTLANMQCDMLETASIG